MWVGGDSCNPWIWCVNCGAYSNKVVKKLAEQCKGNGNMSAVNTLMQGYHPHTNKEKRATNQNAPSDVHTLHVGNLTWDKPVVHGTLPSPRSPALAADACLAGGARLGAKFDHDHGASEIYHLEDELVASIVGIISDINVEVYFSVASNVSSLNLL